MSASTSPLTSDGISASLRSVKEIYLPLRLRDFMDSSEGWGHEHGQAVHLKLLKAVESNPGKAIVRLSLDGVRRTDASFPRESVVELARRFDRSESADEP